LEGDQGSWGLFPDATVTPERSEIQDKRKRKFHDFRLTKGKSREKKEDKSQTIGNAAGKTERPAFKKEKNNELRKFAGT